MKNQTCELSCLEPVLDELAPVSGSLITILQKTQELYGYLPEDAIYHISEKTGISPAKIMGCATFYSQFRLKPIGKNLILLCKGTACHVNGSDMIGDTIRAELGIDDGETTEDGLFTVQHVACLGCCSLSPVMMINGEAYGSLTRDKVAAILRDFKKREAASAGNASKDGVPNPVGAEKVQSRAMSAGTDLTGEKEAQV